MYKNKKQYVCQQLLLKCKHQKDRMTPEKRIMLAQLPKFLEAFKHELLNEESSIWDPTFKPPLGLLLQRKRLQEQNTFAGNISNAEASLTIATITTTTTISIGKKYNEPSTSKKYKLDPDGDDFTDDVVIKAIKKISKSDYANRIEVKHFSLCLIMVFYEILSDNLTLFSYS